MGNPRLMAKVTTRIFMALVSGVLTSAMAARAIGRLPAITPDKARPHSRSQRPSKATPSLKARHD
jgi:hypothetical protein